MHTWDSLFGSFLRYSLYTGAVEWDQYCTSLEEQIRGTGGDQPPSIFGVCRRCGSSRLLVTTRQLRRADEGMTEIRICKNCGHVTKINS